jgi:hypothetical protein
MSEATISRPSVEAKKADSVWRDAHELLFTKKHSSSQYSSCFLTIDNRMTTEEESAGVDREGGTHRVTAPRRPAVIFGIANVFCTGAAVLCSRKDWPALVVGAALGSLATLAGIDYADSCIHSFFLGLAVRSAMRTVFQFPK